MSATWFGFIAHKSLGEILWISFGFLGQLMFSARFLIQWLKSEAHGQSVIPMSFWYFSIFGSMMLLVYSIHIKDIVFVCAQLFGLSIYCRNLILIKNSKRSRSVKIEVD